MPNNSWLISHIYDHKLNDCRIVVLTLIYKNGICQQKLVIQLCSEIVRENYRWGMAIIFHTFKNQGMTKNKGKEKEIKSYNSGQLCSHLPAHYVYFLFLS